jgi:hypothetical protein
LSSSTLSILLIVDSSGGGISNQIDIYLRNLRVEFSPLEGFSI